MPVQTPGVHTKQCEADGARCPVRNKASRKQQHIQKTLAHCCNAWPAHAADTQR